MSEHVVRVELDDQRGGWMARCSCRWEAKRPSWYKRRALGWAEEHVAGARRWGALPMGKRVEEVLR